MKKVLFLFSAVMMLTFQTSCSLEDNPAPDPVQDDLADATIIWYGTGGRNVDGFILENFRQFYSAHAANFDRVNVVAQYKTSFNPTLYEGQDYDDIVRWATETAAKCSKEELESAEYPNYFYLCHPKAGASYRFAIDPKKTLREQLVETEPYGEMNADFTNPDSLTSFINWAATNYPAKKYILFMADHGGGYMPHHDVAEAANSPQRRGLIYDDGHKVNGDSKCFSAKSFARGVRSADVHIDGIVLYLCLMNNMEFLYDVKDVTDYVACSTYLMNAGGGALQSLVDNFGVGLDTRTALANFVDATVDSWDAEFYKPDDKAPDYYDLTLTETKRLDDLAPVLKEFTDRLVNTYQNGTAEQRAAIDSCTANTVKVYNVEPLYDMAKYMESLFMTLPDIFDQDLFNRVKTTFNACIAHQRYAKYLADHNYQVDYSVLLAVRGAYVIYRYDYTDRNLQSAQAYYPDGTWKKYNYIDDGDDISDGNLAHYEFTEEGSWFDTFANTYQNTTFDHLVGWSRWLLINESAPPAWSPSSFNFILPNDDMSGDPSI